MQKKSLVTILLLIGITLSGAAKASLIDRGSGLLYDNVLNVTWLQDANYAKTSGFDTDGKMDWVTADQWAQNMTYTHANGQNYSGFRLAANKPLAGGTSWTNADVGYGIISPLSELAYMYNVNLAPHSEVPYGSQGSQYNLGLAKNVQGWFYWSGTDVGTDIDGLNNLAFAFYIPTGYQSTFQRDNVMQNGVPLPYEFYAWAVHDGDIVGGPLTTVPVPATYALMMGGLGLLSVVTRRRKHQAL